MLKALPTSFPITAAKKVLGGVSIDNAALQEKVVEWVRSAVGTGSGSPSNLSNAHLILFDSHKKSLALRFLENCSPTSLVLLESQQHYASVQREFVAKFSQERRSSVLDGDLRSLVSFHANMKNLLVPTKASPFNEPFLRKIFLPDVELFLQAENRLQTVVVGCLPSPSIQRSLLDSLFAQRVLHLKNTSATDDSVATQSEVKHSTQSVYQLNMFSLITFLHSTTFAQLICCGAEGANGNNRSSSSDADDAQLSFFGKIHQHHAFLYNTLFDVRPLNGRSGFESSCFSPVPPSSKTTSHCEKLEKAGIPRDMLFPVLIRPRDDHELEERFAKHGMRFIREDLLLLIFWLNHVTTELRGSRPCNSELSALMSTGNGDSGDFRRRLDTDIDDQRLVKQVPAAEFFRCFVGVRDALEERVMAAGPVSRLGQLYARFCNEYDESDRSDYVD